jgi:hypothetical protein
MHSFADLAEGSVAFTLRAIRETNEEIVAELQVSAATTLVRGLQQLQLQRAILAVGVFGIFESILQDAMGEEKPFLKVADILERAGEGALNERLRAFKHAINVLKHGRGKSYDALVARAEGLPFRVKPPGEAFFDEGDVAEIRTLIDVDDEFVLSCAALIRDVSNVVERSRPGS